MIFRYYTSNNFKTALKSPFVSETFVDTNDNSHSIIVDNGLKLKLNLFSNKLYL